MIRGLDRQIGSVPGASGLRVSNMWRRQMNSLDAGTAPATGVLRFTTAMTGLATTNSVIASALTALPTGVALVGARCSATNTLELTFVNPTGSGVAIGAQNYIMTVIS